MGTPQESGRPLLQTGCPGVPATGGQKGLDVCEQPNRPPPPGRPAWTAEEDAVSAELWGL